ncbi:MAG: hypothetical protein E7361_00795 [Clostridiales bacterium]|nr:hypothetical protein [Clostridiales bacterium]
MNINIIEHSHIDNTDIVNIRNQFKNIVIEVFDEYFQNKFPSLSVHENIYANYYDEYSLGTNIDNEGPNVLYVTLKNTENLVAISKKETNKIHLDEIKNDIFNLLVQKSKNTTLLWQSKYAINYRYLATDINNYTITENTKKSKKEKDIKNINPVNENVIYNFKIIISQTIRDLEGNYAIKYYAKNYEEGSIRYINTGLNNFAYKNLKTHNNFIDYILTIKNIIKVEKKINYVNFDLIETMLYNIPDSLYKEKFNIISLRNIINYMRNFPLQDYKMLDNDSLAFLSYNSKFTLYDARDIIKTLEKYFNKLNA